MRSSSKKEVKRILKEIRLTGDYVSPETESVYFGRMVDMLQPDTLKNVVKETHSYALRLKAQNLDIAAECQDLKAEGAARDVEIRLLNHDEITWADHDFIIATVKRLGYTAFRRVKDPSEQMKYAWGMFYKQLAYRYHISLRHRSIDPTTGKRMETTSPCLNVLRDDEVPKAVASSASSPLWASTCPFALSIDRYAPGGRLFARKPVIPQRWPVAAL